MFLQASQPDSDGKTRLWLYSELEALYPGVEFQTKNGGDWNRSDGPLKDFIIHREKVCYCDNKATFILFISFSLTALPIIKRD